MKFAIISDTHFGDDNCTLVTAKDGKPFAGNKYEAFKRRAGVGNDYLILLGDVFDFSIASYDKAYRAGAAFFRAIQEDNVAKQIIYIAGNHDADIWHIIQHQRSVINRMQNGKIPEPFRHSTAGIIDDRTGGTAAKFTLDRTGERAQGLPRYGGMFLDKITKPDTVFNFVYPNLYVVTDAGSVLVTHGQYLEPYWAFLGEAAMTTMYDDLDIDPVDVEDSMEMNFPLNQLGCTGIGQAGVLTRVIRRIECDVKEGKTERVKKYLDRAEQFIQKSLQYGWCKKIVAGYVLKKAKEAALGAVGSMNQTRYSQDFIAKTEVRKRFERFYNESLAEISDLNQRTASDIPVPDRIIFGHTHQPIAWAAADAPRLDVETASGPVRLSLHNTGGWLMENGAFCGAEIFRYETGTGMFSVRIS